MLRCTLQYPKFALSRWVLTTPIWTVIGLSLAVFLVGCDGAGESTLTIGVSTPNMAADYHAKALGPDGLVLMVSYLRLDGEVTVTGDHISGTGQCRYSTALTYQEITGDFRGEDGIETVQPFTIEGQFAPNGDALIEIRGCDDIGSPGEYRSVDFSPELPGPYWFTATGPDSEWGKQTEWDPGVFFPSGQKKNSIRFVKDK